MRAHLVTGTHLAAMKAFHGIATGRTIGFLGASARRRDEVREIWEGRGKDVRFSGCRAAAVFGAVLFRASVRNFRVFFRRCRKQVFEIVMVSEDGRGLVSAFRKGED
jgi:hypothetical protein